MKIWFSPRLDKIPQINMVAENPAETNMLAGFLEQLNKLRADGVAEGLVSGEGPVCDVTTNGTGQVTGLTIPLMVGLVETIPVTKFPPERENRERVRLVAKRIPGGRRLPI